MFLQLKDEEYYFKISPASDDGGIADGSPNTAHDMNAEAADETTCKTAGATTSEAADDAASGATKEIASERADDAPRKILFIASAINGFECGWQAFGA